VEDKYTEDDIANLRKEYCALLSMCDGQLGRVLDKLDQYDMWNDTMLIVNTDHGFFLGEHDFIGKNFPPMYDEVIHIPFFIHDPRAINAKGRRSVVAQTVDIPNTILGYFGLSFETETDGTDLLPTIQKDEAIHDTILYGIHGGQVNLYDGHFCYMKSTVDFDLPVYQETVMPTNMRGMFTPEQIDQAVLVNGGRYSNKHQLMRIPVVNIYDRMKYPTVIYDKKKDPKQQYPLTDEALLQQMDEKLKAAMVQVDAPEWQFQRMGFTKEG
jgi:hypothetical protein